MSEITEFLDYASDMYYKGTPIIPDAEFDVLCSHYNYLSVGHNVTDAVPHYFQMYSLQKVFDIRDAPFEIRDAVQTLKLDGAAVSALYVDGVFRLGLTRGNGILGKDITQKLARLIPKNISLEGIRQVTGEVVAPSSIPNARNYAAGALNLKDLEEFRSRDLRFVAYDLQDSIFPMWTDSMLYLQEQGFNVVSTFDATLFPTDGKVFRINDIEKYKSMGHTSKHPRGAFALKSQQKGLISILRKVEWQVGRSGVVSPVAIFDPITIGEAVVTKATLHNIEYIRALGLEIGCKIEVIRSGEIIPRVLRKVI